MESSSGDDNSKREGRLLSSPLILLLFLFAIIAIYQFFFSYSDEWYFMHARGYNFYPMQYVLDVIDTFSYLAIYIIIFVLIYFIFPDKFLVKGIFLLSILFFVVAYLGGFTGMLSYSLFYTHFHPPNMTVSLAPITNYFMAPLAFSVTPSFVSIGAVFARRTRTTTVRA